MVWIIVAIKPAQKVVIDTSTQSEKVSEAMKLLDAGYVISIEEKEEESEDASE